MMETFFTRQSNTLVLRGRDCEDTSISQTRGIMVHVGRVAG